jgi:hypothetical protein
MKIAIKILWYFPLIYVFIFLFVYFERARNSFGNNVVYVNKTKTLVLYAYFEKNDFYIKTLKFFIEIGVEESSQVDYLFIIQGGSVSVELPAFRNVRVLKRPNDCFDFGAYGAGIKWLGGIEKLHKYTHFIFINPSAIGPILPKYWPSYIHWTYIFTSHLRRHKHAVGTSLVCLAYYDDDMVGVGPRIEGMQEMN